jgi:hypothetical protein
MDRFQDSVKLRMTRDNGHDLCQIPDGLFL